MFQEYAISKSAFSIHELWGIYALSCAASNLAGIKHVSPQLDLTVEDIYTICSKPLPHSDAS